MARISLTKEAGGWAYEITDERGVLRASGWTRGTKREGMAEAQSEASRLGLTTVGGRK